MKAVGVLILSIIITFSINAQTTYYVDATNGFDTNNGTSVGSAWKTINKVNQQSFSAGDSILFKRGEMWFGTRLSIESISGTAGNNIVFGAYGVGAKPIISSVVPQSHTWTLVSGNIWKATNPPSNNPNRMLINGVEKLRANIQSELDGITYHWMYDENTNDLYIYSITDPNSFLIEYSTDFPLIIGWAEYITIRDIDIQGGWTGIFINTLSKNIRLDSLDIGKYCRNGVVISSGSANVSDYPENILIENCMFNSYFEFDYSSSTIYSGNSARGCSDGYVTSEQNIGELRNCYFKNWGHASINVNGIGVSNISINSNYLTSPDICYGGRLTIDDASYIEVFNNKIYNTSVTSQLNGQFNHVHHNIFYATTNSPLKPEVNAGVELQGYANSNVKNNIFENNLFANIEGAAFKISGNNNNDIHDNTFRNNIIFNCGSIVNGESIVVEQDLFQATYDNSFQNNLIFNSLTTQTCNFRGELYDVSGFNLQTGTDGYLITNNISDDPLFVDAANDDYHLSPNSPAIDAGTTVLATTDFEGNPIPFDGTNPDIGIYEFQSTLNIGSSSLNENIVIYPNPSKGIITILGNKSQIKELNLVNINGQIVLNNISINEIIDLSFLCNGVYFMRFETSNKIIMKKIIIMD